MEEAPRRALEVGRRAQKGPLKSSFMKIMYASSKIFGPAAKGMGNKDIILVLHRVMRELGDMTACIEEPRASVHK